MTITSRHDSSATILDKVRIRVNQRINFTQESTAFDMGVQNERDEIKRVIDTLEKHIDSTSNTR